MSSVAERLRALADRFTSRAAVAEPLATVTTNATDSGGVTMARLAGSTITVSGLWGGGGEFIVTTPKMREPAREPSLMELGVIEALDDAFAETYRGVATELGLNTAPMDAERFKGWITERGLRVYDRADVQEYLHCKYQVPVGNITHDVKWGWRPLRAADRLKAPRPETNGSVQRSTKPYAKAIPYPVLLTIRDIHQAFPDARFFVSDEFYAERIPDPFLMVEIGHEQFIVERWDEQSFRGTK